jgi:hypothetical protein
MACLQPAGVRATPLFVENEQGKSAVQDAPMFVAIDFAQSAHRLIGFVD